MLFHSTNHQSAPVSFREATIQGLAPDGGLWMMDDIPRMSDAWLQSISLRSFHDIAYDVAMRFMSDEIEEDILRQIIEESFTFPIPLQHVGIFDILELFHGPTLAFKDVGARFMARIMSHFAKTETQELTVLVATSGDTGGAVAHAFDGVPSTRVFILYPRGKVTPMQERQFTTLGENIIALEIDGTFDDCQRLVKQALHDSELRDKLRLASANSINIARLIPQSLYYFATVAHISKKNLPIVFSVPSGNFGNLTAGLIAKKMGLPINKFVAATNMNDVVPEYLNTGAYNPRPSLSTLSNAMDVGSPSNFARMLDLYNGNIEPMRADIAGFSFSDGETLAMIRSIEREDHYMLDPHGAVALLGLRAYQSLHPEPIHGVAFATAHPAKFSETVERAIGKPISIPDSLLANLKREKQSISIANSYEVLRQFLMDSR